MCNKRSPHRSAKPGRRTPLSPRIRCKSMFFSPISSFSITVSFDVFNLQKYKFFFILKQIFINTVSKPMSGVEACPFLFPWSMLQNNCNPFVGKFWQALVNQLTIFLYSYIIHMVINSIDTVCKKYMRSKWKPQNKRNLPKPCCVECRRGRMGWWYFFCRFGKSSYFCNGF